MITDISIDPIPRYWTKTAKSDPDPRAETWPAQTSTKNFVQLE